MTGISVSSAMRSPTAGTIHVTRTTPRPNPTASTAMAYAAAKLTILIDRRRCQPASADRSSRGRPALVEHLRGERDHAGNVAQVRRHHQRIASACQVAELAHVFFGHA